TSKARIIHQIQLIRGITVLRLMWHVRQNKTLPKDNRDNCAK
ncbi:glutamate decarboxylase isozyme, partial [Shigella dysenteriae]